MFLLPLYFKNVFAADCGIHSDVIYRHLFLIAVNSETPSCNYEIVRLKVKEMLSRFPTLLFL